MRGLACVLLLCVGCAKADGLGDGTGGAGEPMAAAGIRVGSVEANQGVAVPIGRDGAGIDGAERNAALIHGRRTLVRAYWELDEDWRPRRIDAVLTLHTHEGEERSLTSTRLVAAPSEQGDLRRAFTWTIEPEDATPGLEYRVELFEADPDDGPASDPDAEPPSTPAEGFFQVGLEPSRQVLDLVMVPIERDAPDCVAKPDTSSERIDILRERLHMMLPVQEVRFALRDPVVWTEPLEELDPIIDFLGELKQTDGARSEVYYYGLLAGCGSVGGAIGQAHSIPVVPVPTQPWTRVATGLSEQSTQSTAHTLVHELGHVLGRRHIDCNGEENKPDESYPYRDGSIGGWGWGVLDEGLRSPAASDYMGYCKDDWVSDFGWNITFWFIRLLGMFPQEGGDFGDPVLVGSIDPDGEQRWFWAQGRVDAPRAHVRWRGADGTISRTPAQITPRPHSDAINVVTTRPSAAVDLASAELVHDGARIELAVPAPASR